MSSTRSRNQATKLLDLAVDVLLHPAFPEEVSRSSSVPARSSLAARRTRISGRRDRSAHGGSTR